MARQFPLSKTAWDAAFPSVADHTTLLEVWGFQESASPVVGQHAGKDLVQNQSLLYQQSGDPQPIDAARYSIEFDTANTNEFTGVSGDTTFGNIPQSGSISLYVRFRAPDNATTARSIAGKGSATAATHYGLRLQSGGTLQARVSDGTVSSTATTATAMDDSNYHDAILVIDSSADKIRIITELEVVETALNATLVTLIDSAGGLAPAASLRCGACMGSAPVIGTRISYMALLSGVMTQADLFTLRGDSVSLSETDTLSESVTAVAAFNPALTETVDLSEALAAVVAMFTAITEEVSFAETVAASQGVSAELSETVDVTDSVAASAELHVALSELVDLVESLDVSHGQAVALEETVDLIESLLASMAHTVDLAEMVTLTELVKAVRIALRAKYDNDTSVSSEDSDATIDADDHDDKVIT